MFNISKLRPSTFIRIGFGAFAIRGVGQYVFDHTGRTSDISDFVFGAVMGIGFGVLGLYIWIYGRRGQQNPPGTCAR